MYSAYPNCRLRCGLLSCFGNEHLARHVPTARASREHLGLDVLDGLAIHLDGDGRTTGKEGVLLSLTPILRANNHEVAIRLDRHHSSTLSSLRFVRSHTLLGTMRFPPHRRIVEGR